MGMHKQSNRILTLLFVSLWIEPKAVATDQPPLATAYYTGAIDKAQNRTFFETVAGRSVKRLIISSRGGEVAAAIELGFWVVDQRLDVEVPDYCLSACANYVFPAGQKKVIHTGAIVAWHGNYHHLKMTGLWKDDITSRMERYHEDADTARRRARAEVDRLVRMEHNFFRHIGVEETLCWIGKMPPYNAPNYYFLSADDMARFGIANVHTPPDYENTNVSKFSDHVVFITLHDEDIR